MSTVEQIDRWRTAVYPSGTCVVVRDEPGEPWLNVGIHGRPGEPEDELARDKYIMCDALRDCLNGGPRPSWLNDLERVRESRLQGADGTLILAVGPLYDADPPTLNWRQCEDQRSKDKRARLIDRLAGIGTDGRREG